MSSNINPNNIDGTYPIAGQDNDSQGFRDNFTNIKTNFEYAASEITDLENKAVLKSALTGTTLDNNMAGALLYAAKIQAFSGTSVALTSTSGTVTLNYSLGHAQTLTPTGNVTLAFSNFPAAGAFGILRLIVTVINSSYTLTLPSSVLIGDAGIVGYDSTTSTMTFPSSGGYVFDFMSLSPTEFLLVNSTTVLQPFNNTASEVNNLDAISLGTTASYFSTASAETATLAAGVSGQIKTFQMFADNGDMVITVTNAGWKTSGTGTITFDTIGDSCILQYVNSKWFCIGNNGCTFA